MTTPQLTARLRGGGCGVLVGALAVAAHGLGGGGVPRSAEIALLLLVSLGAGAFASGHGTEHAAARPISSVGRRFRPGATVARPGSSFGRYLAAGAHRGRITRAVRTFAAAPSVRAGSALIGGQWAGHFALTGTLDHHGNAFDVLHLPSAPMITAHLFAAFVCAALILVAERLYLVASSVIRAVLTAPSLPIPHRAVRWSATVATARGDRPKGVRGPRAPPLFA
ncbi:hypothetical protein ACFU44_26040 [Nocardia rhizosphaerihabitans]|uniref:hypothetical protein n=1 Tax=Nocardia rhizosphaerihabitans TaxID=1691570 RepID=UPI00366B9E82